MQTGWEDLRWIWREKATEGQELFRAAESSSVSAVGQVGSLSEGQSQSVNKSWKWQI